jgi:methionyl-tRNA formyltransferase
MTKKMVARTTDAYVNFDGDTLVSVAEQIKELIETYSGTAYLDYRMEDYSDDYVYKLMTESEETDDEYADRLSKEEARVAWRKREYEVLKKEFGGDN